MQSLIHEAWRGSAVKVVRAAEMGMCFGVRDALAATATIERPEDVTVHGELVHNEEVTARLRSLGFRSTDERDRSWIPATGRVLITAHGVSDHERERLRLAGKELVDTTCPLVRFAHSAALGLARAGWFVVVVGRRGHVEVEGLAGDLGRHAVLERAEDAVDFGEPRIGIVCQTTTPPAHADRVRAAVEAANPDAVVRFVDTVCGPTRNRQLAAADLLGLVEAVVVVGGRGSNNTRELVELARSRGIPAVHVQGPDDLDPEWLARYRVVGLTAGTSTLDGAIDEVHARLGSL